MKINSAITAIVKAAKSGQFISFQYTKETGEKSARVVRFGGDIAAKLERDGQAINGRGAWMTGHSVGLRGMIIHRNGKRYVRGTDTKDGKHKVFCVEGIKLTN